MIVGPTQLEHLVKFHALVHPCPTGKLKKDSIDLALGAIYQHRGGAYLAHQGRDIGNRAEIIPKDGEWILKPNRTYLARTMEEVSMPTYLAAHALGRSTMLRSGCHVSPGYVDPGYKGYLYFLITTPGPEKTTIQFAYPVIQLVFCQAEPVVPYDGAYQGGNLAPGI